MRVPCRCSEWRSPGAYAIPKVTAQSSTCSLFVAVFQTKDRNWAIHISSTKFAAYWAYVLTILLALRRYKLPVSLFTVPLHQHPSASNFSKSVPSPAMETLCGRDYQESSMVQRNVPKSRKLCYMLFSAFPCSRFRTRCKDYSWPQPFSQHGFLWITYITRTFLLPKHRSFSINYQLARTTSNRSWIVIMFAAFLLFRVRKQN